MEAKVEAAKAAAEEAQLKASLAKLAAEEAAVKAASYKNPNAEIPVEEAPVQDCAEEKKNIFNKFKSLFKSKKEGK